MTLKLPVAIPPWSKGGRKIESAVRKALWEYSLLPEDGKLCVALSGGKDSLTLLFMLKAISGAGFPKLDLSAVHISGAFSCGAGVDSGYLRAICEQLGVRYVERETKQTLDELECYSCSRERRKLIFDAAKELGATTIAFGHHSDDSAQTLLMNLLHKGEFSAMLTKIRMQHYGITIIRPLAFVAEEQIREFARVQGFARILCRCPVGANSQRRRVDELLSEIEELYPNARKNIARAGMLYGSDKAARP